jgi:hypothetical protein
LVGDVELQETDVASLAAEVLGGCAATPLVAGTQIDDHSLGRQAPGDLASQSLVRPRDEGDFSCVRTFAQHTFLRLPRLAVGAE